MYVINKVRRDGNDFVSDVSWSSYSGGDGLSFQIVPVIDVVDAIVGGSQVFSIHSQDDSYRLGKLVEVYEAVSGIEGIRTNPMSEGVGDLDDLPTF